MLESWKQDIPSLSRGLAIVILLLNIFIPPLGTFLLSCFGGSFKPTQLIIALLQLLLLGILIGWVWSVWWGILTMEKCHDSSAVPIETV